VASLVNDVAPFVLLACACGAAVTTTTATPAPVPPPAAAQVAAAPVPAPAESFDDLVAQGPTVAPGMREIARKASGEEAVELLRADTGDACVRIAFAAAGPIVAKLVDQGGEVLASVGPAAEGALGERGPVCVRKGDVVRATAEGAGRSRVRWVVWQAP
jgi:hypothetical protein